ncbi:MAG: porin [Nevskia sp.]|nr:porin [Nevskia sp.]
MTCNTRILARGSAALMFLGTGFGSGAAQAFAVETGGITFSVSGNVNTNYTFTNCDKNPGMVAGSLLCGAPAGASSHASSLNSGNLPNGIVLGVKTQVSGVDTAVVYGFYPGVANNDFAFGNGPNLGSGAGNVALGSPNLDIRQVYATFSTAELGTLKVGRDYSMLGFDAIVNDITLIAVGVASVRTATSPANTTLGTIGFGHLFSTPNAGITYITPNFSGPTAAIGIYQPLDAIPLTGIGAGSSASAKPAPQVQAQVKYKFGATTALNGFASVSGLYQKQELTVAGAGATLTDSNPVALGGDFTGKIAYAGAAIVGHYYYGEGLGAYSYFIEGFSPTGKARVSQGGYLQATYTYDKTTLGANYGISRLNTTSGDADGGALLKANSKYTIGLYHKLLANLTVTTEYTDAKSKANSGATINTSNYNVGFFISF